MKTIIFSAWRATNDLLTNLAASHAVREELLNITNYDAVGSYREAGQTVHAQEVSHVVETCCAADYELCKRLAKQHNQDSILVIDNSVAYLEMLDTGITLHLGQWTEVSKQEAINNECYTYTMAGEYFICK